MNGNVFSKTGVSMFKKATRKKVKLRLGLIGPSGSGKTYSALTLAKGLLDANGGGKAAAIDTENRSAELYAGHPDIGLDFDVAILTAPYKPDRYIQLIKGAADAGYDIVIVDSMSHAWMGEGGMLDMVDKKARAGNGNSFQAWGKVKPLEREFLSALINTDIHIIATMRTKTEYVVETVDGKKVPKKIGMRPEQREGIEYEFTTVFDLSNDGNIATASKDRTTLFMGDEFKITKDTGRKLHDWLNSGEAAAPAPQYNPGKKMTEEQKRQIWALAKKLGWKTSELDSRAFKDFGAGISELFENQARKMIESMETSLKIKERAKK